MAPAPLLQRAIFKLRGWIDDEGIERVAEQLGVHVATLQRLTNGAKAMPSTRMVVERALNEREARDAP